MKICDELDCPLHPDYVQAVYKKHVVSQVPEVSTLSSHGPLAWSSLNSVAMIPTIKSKDSCISVENSIKLETKYMTSYIECFFCQYRKNIDMKKEIIVANAKQLLQE